MEPERLVGEVPDAWEYTTLGKACALGGGRIQTGPFGSQLHASDYVANGVPTVMPQNLGDNRIIEDGIARIRLVDAERLGRHRLRAGDIVYSRRGDVEKRALVRTKEEGWLCGTGSLMVRMGLGPVEPTYASYYLGHPSVRAWITQHAHGATMPNLNTEILSSLPFVLPPLPEQRAIAHILGTLDDKIELNRRMNETLEAIARALFTSWFVDFDPVRAKAEGRDTGLPADIAALFPDSFEDSALGEIPKGWGITSVGEHTRLVKGRSYSSRDLRESSTALVTLKSFLRGGGYRVDGLKSYAGSYLPEQVVHPGELIVACTDVTQGAEVIGHPALVRAAEGFPTLVASLDVLIVRPNAGPEFIPFYYCLFNTPEFIAHTYAYSTGTTVLHLHRDAVPSFPLTMPPQNLLAAFATNVAPTFQRLQTTERESSLLSELRDTLLPKLMSGELRVPAAAEIVEETVG